jgi:alpha-L-arabinofuranosidase
MLELAMFQRAALALAVLSAGSLIPAGCAEFEVPADMKTPAHAQITVHADRIGPRVSPMLHGIFYEDINFAGDGGLYAELIQNRSFEHKESRYAWSEAKRGNAQGSFTVESTGGMNAANPHYLRLNVQGGAYGIANTGFGGIALKRGDRYTFALRARANDAFRNGGSLLVLLQDKNGNVLGEARISNLTSEWKEHTAQLTASATNDHAQLSVLALNPGQVDLDVISLFPEKTFKNRKNGMRADLAQFVADMKPAFMRFPGGCIVEGDCRENMYRWKETIGDIAQRKQNHNRWMSAFPIKSPQYYQTFGLGFFEYFQLCEDMGAEPLPVVNCGMSCQFQQANFWMCPIPELGEFVQDALDLIEFANGPVTSTWGAKRAAMGHPEPFNLKYLAIGNEQWGEDYLARYKIFHEAIKAKFPQMNLVTSSGPGVDDVWWNLSWGKFKDKSIPAEIVDEHYYRPPRWFYNHVERYDNYDRNGPKVFAGEYAAHPLGLRNNMHAALAEAAFITGLIRNTDVVTLSSYAPLFAKIGDTQWIPDMIWFTNTQVYGTPTYHAAVMFGQNVGDVVLPLEVNAPETPVNFVGKGISLFSENCIAEYRNVKITSGDKTVFAPEFRDGLGDWKAERGDWTANNGLLRSEYQLRGRIHTRVAMPQQSTITLQARKTSGTGGFGLKALSDTDDITWLVGARGNTRHELQMSFDPLPVDGKIEDNRWHDIKMELDGRTVKAYLDGKLMIEKTLPVQKGLFAVATRDDATREVIVKAVNPTGQPIQTALRLEGVTGLQSTGKAIVLASRTPFDENTLDKPQAVAPREVLVPNVSANFTHTFAPYSVTVMRLKTQ